MSGTGGVEEVGARLLIEGGAEFKAQLDEARAALADYNAELRRTATLTQRVADRMAAAAGTTDEALGKTDEAMTAATDRLAAFNAEQERAAEASKVSAASIARSQKVVADALNGGAAAAARASAEGTTSTWKKAVAASGKIVKWGMLGVTAVAYEGIKNYMTFQQQIAQMAIDAGVRKSQLPAFENAALRVSNAYGIAANSVGEMMYRIASANPKLHMTTRSMEQMANAAGQLYVMAGATGDPTSISRMYGAIVANHMRLTQHSGVLAYNAKSAAGINEWALQTAGHGDVYTGDLVSALGTGVVPVASALHLSLNQLGGMLDVLFPAMGASAASTRTKTALGMLAAPSTITGPLYSMTGGTALSIANAMAHGGPVAAMAALNKMLHTRLTAQSAANYYNQFLGGGLGTFHGGSKGKATGAIAFLRAHGFSEAQIRTMMTSPQGIAAVPSAANYLVLHSFGAGHAGAAVLQWLDAYRTGELQTKITAIRQGETPTSYASALRLAMHEPIRQWDIFWNKLKNLTIYVGRDLTPAFDGLLHTLEKVGSWFGKNKWALDSLLGLAGGIFAGAAAIKTAQAVHGVVKGAQAIYKVVAHPILAVKRLFGIGNTAVANGSLDTLAAAADRAALALDRVAGGGIPGVARGARAAETGIATSATADATSVLPEVTDFGASLTAATVGSLALGLALFGPKAKLSKQAADAYHRALNGYSPAQVSAMSRYFAKIPVHNRADMLDTAYATGREQTLFKGALHGLPWMILQHQLAGGYGGIGSVRGKGAYAHPIVKVAKVPHYSGFTTSQDRMIAHYLSKGDTLPQAIAEMKAMADKLHTAADRQQTSADLTTTAAHTLEAAATHLETAAAGIAVLASPQGVYAAHRKGLHHKVARK